MSGTFAQTGIGVMFPFIQEELGLTRAQLGLIASMMVVGGAATGLLGGWMADVMGVRRLQTITRLSMAAGAVVFSQVHSLPQALLLALFIGIANSPSYANVTKAISEWVLPRTRGLAMGIEQSSITFSGIIVSVLLTAIAVSHGWRTAIIIAGLAMVVATLVFYAFYRDKRPAEDGGARTRPGGRVALVARDRNIWIASLYGVLFNGFQPVVVSYLILFLREELDMSAVAAGGLLGVAMGGGAVGRIGWGLVSDVLRGGRVLTLMLVSLLAGLSMVLLVWLPGGAPLGLVVLLVFFMGGTTLASPGLYAVLIAEQAGPRLTGTAMGFTIMITTLGGFAVAPIFGLIVDRTGSYDQGWWMMAGLAGLATSTMGLLLPQAWARRGGEVPAAGGGTHSGPRPGR
jgi:nitrate/nitrite transporter NarK